MTRSRKIALWIGAGFGGLLILAVLFSLLVPLLVDEQEIRARLQRTLDEHIEGTVDFESLRISFFPPRGKLSNISISVPEHDVAGVAESATAYLRILPIFIGRVEIGSVEVRRPDFRLAVPEIGREPEKEKSKEAFIENLAGAAYGALSQLTSVRPDLEVLIENGRLSLTRGEEPLIVFNELSGEVELPPDKLDISIHSASNVWESLSFTAKMDTRKMKGEGRVEVKQLQPHLVMSAFAPQSNTGLGDSLIDAAVRFRMKEYMNIEGDVEASAPKLTLRRRGNIAPARIEKLTGQYHFAERQMSFTVTELEMGNPRMKLSGRLLMDRDTPGVLAELSAEEVNVNAVRDLSLSLAGDVPMVKRAFDSVKGGVIDRAVIASRGKSWEELAEPENMDIQATVSTMGVNVPEVGLDLNGITGKLSLSHGMFKGQELSARMGNSQASNGDFAVGIQGENPPFRLNMDFVADLAQGLPILRELVKDDGFIAEINRIKHLEGSAQGRLTLGERMDSLRPEIEIREMNLKGEYERVPYPVEVSRGRFTYEGNQISWSDLTGRMSNTQVTRTAGRVDFGETARLEVASDKAVLNLGELYPWINTLGQITALKELDSLKGQVSLSAIELKGPLKNPKEWVFQGKGEAEDLLVESSRLPAILKVDKAVFSGNPNQIELEQTQTALLDAAVSLSGVIKEYMQGSPQVSLNFEGTIGPQAKEWISATMDL
ncbi:MAG: AsmA family protein, partial [Desulfobacterales bacterium]|nr:AsmA family protein [Desulfobacterales bacterium]